MAFDLVGKAVKNLRLPTVDYSNFPIKIIPAQEGDINSRFLSVTLFDDRGDIPLDTYTKATLNATLPDGELQMAEGEIDKEKNMAICKIAGSMLSQLGKVSCDIVLTGKDSVNTDTSLTSQTFYLFVAKSQSGDDAIEGSDDYPVLVQLLNEVSELEDDIETAEEARVATEQDRATEEATRASNETERMNAERDRVTAENNRESEEIKRVSAETARASDETIRKTNETSRENTEIARKTAEEARVAAEQDRVVDENTRVLNETERINAESERVTAETKRENAYKELEANLQNAFNDAEKFADQAKDAAEEAVEVSGKVKAETEDAATRAETAATRAEVAADSVENLEAQVKRNSKYINALWAGVDTEEDPFVTDDSTAYKKIVPVNALPYAELNKLGGVSYWDYSNRLRDGKVTEIRAVGRNLFNMEDLYLDYRVTVDGGSFTIENLAFFHDLFSGTGGQETNFPIEHLDKLIYVGTGPFTVSWDSEAEDSQICVARINPKDGTYLGSYSGKDSGYVYTLPEPSYITLRRVSRSKPATYSNFRVTMGATVQPYEPYSYKSFPIPAEVQALEGYGQSNPLDPTEYNYLDLEKKCFVAFGHALEGDGDWATFNEARVTDLSDVITDDNFIEVVGGSPIIAVNEHGFSVPSTITYMVEGDIV